MVTATRLLLIVLTIFSIPIYLVFIVPEGVIMQAAGAILILLLISLILFTGRRPIPIENKKNNPIVQTESDFGDIELPPPVHSEESVTETRETKIQRTRGRSRASEGKEGAIPQPLPQPSQMTVEMPQTTISEDDVESEGTAQVHVVKSDPEIQAEAEVDQYLAQQRERRVVFRDRINRERRLEMSKRLAQKVRKFLLSLFENSVKLNHLLLELEINYFVLVSFTFMESVKLLQISL